MTKSLCADSQSQTAPRSVLKAQERVQLTAVRRGPSVVVLPFPAAVAVPDEADGLALPHLGEDQDVDGDVLAPQIVREDKAILSLNGGRSIGQSSHRPRFRLGWQALPRLRSRQRAGGRDPPADPVPDVDAEGEGFPGVLSGGHGQSRA